MKVQYLLRDNTQLSNYSTMPRSSWNIAKSGVKHKSINQSIRANSLNHPK
jgi:hypothetical protein